MKIKLIFVFFVLILLLSMISAENKINKEVLKKFDSQEKVKVIVKLKDDKLNEKNYFEKGLSRNNGVGIKDSKDKYKNYIYKEVYLNELNKLKEDISVEEILESHEIHAFLQQVVGIVNSSLTNTLKISGINLTGTQQIICIIDTGINFTHPDLIGKNKSCVVDCFDKLCVENCSIGDDNGHGTHVAGISAASGGINGIATNASLIGIKILDSSGDGSGNSLDLNRAIDWCVKENVSVISMSLGTIALYNNDCSASMGPWTESIDAAFAKNISVIASTGNDANYTAIASPACIANVTPVGDTYDANVGSVAWSACTDSSTAIDKIVCHANRNSLVKLFAPGAQINSTKSAGGYIEYGGTSMAAPVVAGAFAIIHQLLNLTAQTRTPSQIENILNSTGKIISDTSSGLSFSRINVYEAVLSLDNIAPNVSLISPLDNHLNLTKNQTFSCNASDWQLSNLTFSLWNSSSLFYNETRNISGNLNVSSFNFTDLEYDIYKWNCKAYDARGNVFQTSNFSLTIGGVQTTLISPADQTYKNTDYTDFTCKSISGTYELFNVSFYLWNSTGFVYNITKNISGFDNSTNFNYSFVYEENYKWNCLSFNNNSNSSWASNFTIIYDASNPIISSLSSSVSTSSSTITWTTNENANSSIDYGTTAGLGNNNFNSSLTTNHSVSLTGLASSTLYYYNLTCCDKAGNCIVNGTNSFTTSTPVTTSSSGGGGGGGAALAIVYTPTETQISGGYTKELSKNNKIKFFDENSKEHTLTLTSIEEDFVEITIQSSPIKLKLGIGQSVKLNLTSSDYYNLYVKLNSVENNKASLTIQTIHEEILKKSSEEKPEEETEDRQLSMHDEEKAEEGGLYEINSLKNIIYGLVLIIIAIVIFLLIKERKFIKDIIKKQHINNYKEKFEKEVKPRKYRRDKKI